MSFWQRWRKPRLSVVVVFYNMRREAQRTLFTLSSSYQRQVECKDYEVIAVDSGSTQPLDADWVEGIQENFRYLWVDSKDPTPCQAMNEGIRHARASKVMCMVDGARMLTPGVLHHSLQIFTLYPNAYIHTLAYHLGHKLQHRAMCEDGYDQNIEDALLQSVNWRIDGYRLYEIACLAASSQRGYFGALNESNCFALDRRVLLEMGGFDENFKSRGGGFVNLDIHRRLMENSSLKPVVLLGEGSFHQFHGGVATNATDTQKLIEAFAQEYLQLRGEPFRSPPVREDTLYFGTLPEESRRFLYLEEDEGK